LKTKLKFRAPAILPGTNLEPYLGKVQFRAPTVLNPRYTAVHHVDTAVYRWLVHVGFRRLKETFLTFPEVLDV